MKKEFNAAAACIPQLHYMVNLDKRLEAIKRLSDRGKYFTISRARQYGKTTTLLALEQYLKKDYYVIFMDFQMFGNAEFKSEHTFAVSFADTFLKLLYKNSPQMDREFEQAVCRLANQVESRSENFALKALFENLSDICAVSRKPIVLMIDETDSAADEDVFFDFLAQLRAYYIRRAVQPALHSVILAGVYDVKNLKWKFSPQGEQIGNSPWNIAADFNVDMSFSREEIAGMLHDYELDCQTGMDIAAIAGMLHDYTSGYPFLVSRLCQLMDEAAGSREAALWHEAWSKDGFQAAVRVLLTEKNTLFDSLFGKLASYPQLHAMLHSLLFTGKGIVFNADEPAIDMAVMFGFIRNEHGMAAVANRIFETRLYNFYLSSAQMQNLGIYKASVQDKNQFIQEGRLNMRLILEKFTVHFRDLYGGSGEAFLEEEGRKYFLLYLKPIINGAGNYYVESRTRELQRTDVVVDYGGMQYVIEMKIWHGDEYNRRGEEQLARYLDDYHLNTGYMISFCFPKSRRSGVREIHAGDKTIIEAFV